jgi:hypothetical protein
MTFEIPHGQDLRSYILSCEARLAALNFPQTVPPTRERKHRAVVLRECLGLSDARRYVYHSKLMSFYDTLGSPDYFHYQGIESALVFDMNTFDLFHFEEKNNVMLIPPGSATGYIPGAYIKNYDKKSFALIFEDGNFLCLLEKHCTIGGNVAGERGITWANLLATLVPISSDCSADEHTSDDGLSTPDSELSAAIDEYFGVV